MRRFVRMGLWALVAVLVMTVSAWTFAQAGTDKYMMVGVVVAEERVALEVEDQLGAAEAVTVSRVLAPDDSWLVVHLDDDGMPGKRIGLLRVDEGESVDLSVPLDEPATTPNVIVALHADRGRADEFEFDKEKFMSSPDKPYFVEFEEVAVVVAIAEFGVVAEEGQAGLEAGPDAFGGDTVMLSRVTAPAEAWVVVHLDDNGMPGKRVGLLGVRPGESREVTVVLEEDGAEARSLIVALHADRGQRDEFEFDMDDKLGSPDQPFFIDGEEVAVVVERE